MITDALIAPFTEFEFMRRALAAVIALSLGAAPIGAPPSDSAITAASARRMNSNSVKGAISAS